MDEELQRLSAGLIENLACLQCGSRMPIPVGGFEEVSGDLFETLYECPGCSTNYNIQIEDYGHGLHLSGTSTNSDHEEFESPGFSKFSRKEALEAKTHPIKDLVEGLHELRAALSILRENKDRILEACEILREEGFEKDPAFHRKVGADIHNYMASSYSYEEILGSVKPNLPTDGPVESAVDTFNEENQVIKGLRTYAQHYRTISHSFTATYPEQTEGGDTESGLRTVTVSMEDVGEDEVEDFEYKDPSISFDKVDRDFINIERRVELHYEAAEDLVDSIHEHAESTHSEELED